MLAKTPPSFTGKDIRIVIAGSGVSGILMAIRLKKAGFHNFRILEKAASLGGTWRDNVYPGIACDTPAHTYVYSFELNADYKYTFASGPELLAYYQRTSDKYGVTPHMTFNAEITSAEWNGAAWDIKAGNGETLQAEVFISCCGRLHHPVIPDIPGLQDFKGPWFHSARWDKSVPLDGKRIGVIGAGSSATQIVTALADRAAKVVNFQRSAHWFLSPPNPYFPLWKRMYLKYMPGALRKYFYKVRDERETIVRERMSGPEGRKSRMVLAEAALARIADPVLREKMRPNYEIACKRIIVSAGFPEALNKPTVELVPGDIERVEANGVRMADGSFHELDVLCLATGFKSDAYMRPMKLTGLNGVTLDEIWKDNYVNYRTVSLPHMPNFFMINGPFSPGGTTPIVRGTEVQTNYVLELIQKVAAEGGAVKPNTDKAAAFLAEAQERGKTSIWVTGGCKSWYLDKNGVPIVDPLLPSDLEQIMKHAHFEDFDHIAAEANA